jgi:hypothetical protein
MAFSPARTPHKGKNNGQKYTLHDCMMVCVCVDCAPKKRRKRGCSRSAWGRNQCPLAARGTIFPIICGSGVSAGKEGQRQLCLHCGENGEASEPLNQHSIYWNTPVFPALNKACYFACVVYFGTS